jgi:uncharacterized membrane protein YfcA
MDLTLTNMLELVLLGVVAGGIGSMTGIGGGLIITPVLTLVFGVPIHHAIGASLCCVIATSSGAAASYVEHRLSDIRLGMTLELATTVGAITGSLIAGLLSRGVLALAFALFLITAASSMVRRHMKANPAGLEDIKAYKVRRLPLGLLGSGGAGIISGLLGVGGGIIKVPLMYLVMGVPFKVATATSNFMIGVTAAASAFIYYSRGDVRPLIAAPAAVGVFFGAGLGARLMRRVPSGRLVILLSVIMLYFAMMMIWKAFQEGFFR